MTRPLQTCRLGRSPFRRFAQFVDEAVLGRHRQCGLRSSAGGRQNLLRSEVPAK